ncbi:MAG: hypothetical protein JF621_05760 [Streptomyces turgidiscabies]|nr:hypothetical protein [Streptomyces turgidiscabies]
MESDFGTLRRLDSSPRGLTDGEAEARLAAVGENVVPAARPVPWALRFLRSPRPRRHGRPAQQRQHRHVSARHALLEPRQRHRDARRRPPAALPADAPGPGPRPEPVLRRGPAGVRLRPSRARCPGRPDRSAPPRPPALPRWLRRAQRRRRPRDLRGARPRAARARRPGRPGRLPVGLVHREPPHPGRGDGAPARRRGRAHGSRRPGGGSARGRGAAAAGVRARSDAGAGGAAGSVLRGRGGGAGAVRGCARRRSAAAGCRQP